MNTPRCQRRSNIDQPLVDDWQERSEEERRSDLDNRDGHDNSYFENGGRERRKSEERRHPEERRDGWLRVGRWRSESVFDHKN